MLKIVLTIAILFYACILDWRSREIDDFSWLSLVALGVVFFLYDVYTFRQVFLLYIFIFSAIFIIIIAEGLVRLGLMGGGDGKILLGIGVLYYQVPSHLQFVIPYFPLSAFINGLLLSSAVPLVLFLYNIVKVRKASSLKDIFMFFNGYKRPGNQVRWYEAVIDASNVKNFFIDANTIELGTTLDTDEEVWVSPSIPFLIPLTAGFLFAYLGMDFFTIISGLWIFVL